MSFEHIKGTLVTLHGQQLTNGGDWIFSVFEIDQRILTDVRVSHKLSAFLTVGNYVEIWREKSGFKPIIGVVRNDRILLEEISKPGKLSLIIGLLLIPVGAIGVVVLLNRWYKNRKLNQIKELISRHKEFQYL